MSYQVLARKWRPKSFASLVGQEHVVRALTHALGEQRLHHAYLFTGTRGVGKTTLARILAKSLNCETGVTATPCGSCSSCLEIDTGRFVDLLEVDAATNTRVDEMRQLLENAVYAPTRGRFKVYVIDEVHMLSNSAFNAMLKTLEEPPEHVKFILATTDPQKIPVTVLSRCLQFNLKQMTPSLIAGHLKEILAVEGIEAEPAALNLLSRSASGSMRDALSLLDQAIAHGAGKVDEAQVRDMLGTVDLDYLFDILDALCAGDALAMLAVADDMALRSLSFAVALQELAALLTRIQIAQLAPEAVADDLPERGRLLDMAARMDAEFVQLAYQIAVHGRQELPLAPDEQTGFTMALLRLHTFRPMVAGEQVLARVNRVAAPSVQGRMVAQPAAPSATAVPSQSGASSVRTVDESKSVSSEQNDAPVLQPQKEGRAAPAAEASPPGSSADWLTIVGELKIGAMARELAQNCLLRELGTPRIVLSLDPAQRHLLIKPAQDKLQQALSEYYARPVQLVVELEAIAGETPAVVAQKERQERQVQAEASVTQDEFVREAVDLFDARVVDDSIKPL